MSFISSRSNPKAVDPTTFTPHFHWKRNSGRTAGGEEIFCEGVSLADTAEKFETPAYVYSCAAITDAFRELDRGLAGVPHTLARVGSMLTLFFRPDKEARLLKEAGLLAVTGGDPDEVGGARCRRLGPSRDESGAGGNDSDAA